MHSALFSQYLYLCCLQINYGDLYEKVRVRKGYARTTGAKKQALLEDCKYDDAETLRDIGQWSVASVYSCLQVLEKCLLDDERESPFDDFYERTLIFALGLRARILSIEDDFRDFDFSQTDDYCDSGASSMVATGVVSLSIYVVKLACTRCYAHAHGLVSGISSHEMLKVHLMKCLRLSEEVLFLLNADEILKTILEF